MACSMVYMKRPTLRCGTCGRAPRLANWKMCRACYGRLRSRGARKQWARAKREKAAVVPPTEPLPSVSPEAMADIFADIDRATKKVFATIKTLPRKTE